MNTDTPKPFRLEASRTTTRKYRWHSPSPTKVKLDSAMSVLMSAAFGGMLVMAFVCGIPTSGGEFSGTPDSTMETGFALIAIGIMAVVGGLAIGRRREWGWWLMLGLGWVLIVAITPASMAILGYQISLWRLRPLSGFAGPRHRLEGDLEEDIDAIARSLGIDWNATPFGRIGELLAARRNVEATQLYRELFGCVWDEAHAGIARWHTETLTHKLRYIARVVKSRATGRD